MSNKIVSSIVQECVKIGFITKEESEACIGYIGNITDYSLISERLHFFKFADHYRLLYDVEKSDSDTANGEEALYLKKIPSLFELELPNEGTSHYYFSH